MKTLKTLAGATLLLALVACGSSKTQDKIDTANDDYQRMRVIDVELRSLGVNLGQASSSAATIEVLDPGTLERVRGLLSEFLSRGDNVVTTSQRKDVKVLNDGMGNLQYAMRQANRLKIKVLETIGARSNNFCAPGAGSSAVARQAAQSYVGSLRLSRRVDWDRVQTERLETGCGLFRVTFRSLSRSSCALTLLVDRSSILHDRSDSDFICR